MTDPGFQMPTCGHFCLTTFGHVTAETLISYADTRVFLAQHGLTNIRFPVVSGILVDKARNEAAAQMLADPESQFLFFVDGDMQWQPDAVARVFETAYKDLPDAAIVGGWCALRGEGHIPTIDPGSGTWEPIAPNSGPMNVMRTGSAFVLIKRIVFETLTPPWYGIRYVPRPVDAFLEVDSFMRTKFDGDNPLRQQTEWQKAVACAQEDARHVRDPKYPYQHVGEDSNLADRANAAGLRVVVQTNAVTQHVDKHLITPESHLEKMRDARAAEARASGVLG